MQERWSQRAAVRFACGGLAVAGALGLAACGGSDSSSSGPAVAKGCTPKHSFKTANSGKLTVAISPSLPYVDVKDGKLVGIDGEIVNKIAALECLSLKLETVAGAAGLQGVQSGRQDVAVGGWYRTPERAKVIGQTQPLYYDFTAVLSKDGLDQVGQLKGKKVGLTQGSLYVKDMENLVGASNVKLYQLTDGVIQDLNNGRIGVAILGSGEGGYRVKQTKANLQVKKIQPDAKFSWTTEVGEPNLPFPKSNTALGTALDADIATLRKDGTVKAILDKYGLSAPENFQPAAKS